MAAFAAYKNATHTYKKDLLYALTLRRAGPKFIKPGRTLD